MVKKGEVLRIDLGGKPRLHHLELIPGYAKNDKMWRANRRVTKVRARTWLDGEARPWKIGELDPPDALPKGDPPWLGVDFGRELRADTIELEVLESEDVLTALPAAVRSFVFQHRQLRESWSHVTAV